jgi:hypothetical protein
MHPYTAQRIAAERHADLLRAARRAQQLEATPSQRRPLSLQALLPLRYARRAAGAAGAAARSGT